MVLVTLTTSSPARGISSRTLFTPTGSAADQMGYSVASAGDVNGDGFPDVIVGAPLNDGGGLNAGRAYIYYGGPTGDASPDLTLTGAASGDNFGYSVASAGDVNGDGFADVIVGAPYNDVQGADAGRAYVYYGGPSPDATADLTLATATAGDNFGFSVASAGDMNGDGFADVIVGAPFYDVPYLGVDYPDGGRACVYFGGIAADVSPDVIMRGDWYNLELGYSVASAGHVNGDIYSDVIVGAHGVGGRALLYYGGIQPDPVSDLEIWRTGQFGSSVSAADVNGDGFADLFVGAPGDDTGGPNAGRAFVFYGGPLLNATADLVLTGSAPSEEFGSSVAEAGDVNGDGFADLIVGGSLSESGGTSAGRAYVYFGGPAADATADLTMDGFATDDRLGISVASAGDIDGDGYDDVVVGAHWNDAGGSNAGRAYVTAVYPYRLLSPNGGELWVATQETAVWWRGRDAADLAISFDDGANWTTLLSNVGGADENGVAVNVPAVVTNGARFRVSYAGLPVTHATSDVSDGVFGIMDVPTTAVDLPEPATLPRFSLGSNPARGRATLVFHLDREAMVSVTAHDLTGRAVAHPVNDELMMAGRTARDWQPAGLASGLYFLVVRIGDLRESRTLVWLQ